MDMINEQIAACIRGRVDQDGEKEHHITQE